MAQQESELEPGLLTLAICTLINFATNLGNNVNLVSDYQAAMIRSPCCINVFLALVVQIVVLFQENKARRRLLDGDEGTSSGKLEF